MEKFAVRVIHVDADGSETLLGTVFELSGDAKLLHVVVDAMDEQGRTSRQTYHHRRGGPPRGVALAAAHGSTRKVAAGTDKWRLAGLPLVRHPVTDAEQIEDCQEPTRDP